MPILSNQQRRVAHFTPGRFLPDYTRRPRRRRTRRSQAAAVAMVDSGTPAARAPQMLSRVSAGSVMPLAMRRWRRSCSISPGRVAPSPGSMPSMSYRRSKKPALALARSPTRVAQRDSPIPDLERETRVRRLAQHLGGIVSELRTSGVNAVGKFIEPVGINSVVPPEAHGFD